MVTYSAEDCAAESVIRRAAELRKGVLIKKGLGSGTLMGSGTRSLEEMLWPIFSVTGISSLIVGTLSPEHLRANVRAVAALI
jgi:aryl-alcohol dehydrogenase-like predicted oxidoreductase